MHQYLASCVTERSLCRSHRGEEPEPPGTELLILGIPVKSETRTVLDPGPLREAFDLFYFL